MNDTISRQAAIEHLKKRLYETALNNDTDLPYYEEIADNRVSVWLEEVPVIEPKRGKWLFVEYPDGYYHTECSECGKEYSENVYFIKEPNYCPNCGAMMVDIENTIKEKQKAF